MRTLAAAAVTAVLAGLQSSVAATHQSLLYALRGSSDLSTIRGLLESSNFGQAIDTRGNVTLLAPRDSAFVATAQELGYEGREVDEATTWLEDAAEVLFKGGIELLLRYHALPAVLNVKALLKRKKLETFQDAVIRTDGEALVDKAGKIADARVVEGRVDIAIGESVVHVIDRVLLPVDVDPADIKKRVQARRKGAGRNVRDGEDDTVQKGSKARETVYDVASAGAGEFDTTSEDFDIFVKLCDLVGLSEVLRGNGPFTLFLPKDAAFLQTAQDFGYTGHDEDDAYELLLATFRGMELDLGRELSDLLRYHIADGELSAADVLSADRIETLQGDFIVPSSTDPLVLEDKAGALPSARVIDLDIPASNGVVHCIDRLLLPYSQEYIDAAIFGEASSEETPEAVDVSPSPEDRTGDDDGATDSDSGESACFPASAVVHMADGHEAALGSLRAGQVVRATDDDYSAVFLFSHRRVTGMYEFVRLESESGRAITLSGSHYVYANGQLTAADAVRVGDLLATIDGASRVSHVAVVRERGLVAPHTLHGDIVVNGVRASSYTRSVHPTLAHLALFPLRYFVRTGLAVEPLGKLLYDGADWLASYVPSGPSSFA